MFTSAPNITYNFTLI